MKISILIPTHNYAPVNLVKALDEQCRRILLNDKGFDFEIIVADDASSYAEILKVLHKNFDNNEKVRIKAFSENQGRAAIRNRLAEMAESEVLLFLDSDAMPYDDDFVYSMLIHSGDADVICPVLRNPSGFNPTGKELRYRYEMKAEQEGKRTAGFCNKSPYDRFATFCFLTKKSVMLQNMLNETLTRYGYEDVLLGKSFERSHISVKYVDIPLIHTGINDSQTFLRNTEHAMQNLAALQKQVPFYSPIAETYERLRIFRISGLFRATFCIFKPLIVKNLLGHHPNLTLYNVYKLGIYAECVRKVQ